MSRIVRFLIILTVVLQCTLTIVLYSVVLVIIRKRNILLKSCDLSNENTSKSMSTLVDFFVLTMDSVLPLRLLMKKINALTLMKVYLFLCLLFQLV